MTLRDHNNSAAKLIARGKLDEAERILDRTAGSLEAADTADEYFHRVHRVVIAWHRERYEEALPHAERAYALERELGKTGVAYSAGSWAIVSVLTRLRRFDEARAVFEQIVRDERGFSARVEREPESAEKVLVAGMCIFFESGDFAPHRKLVRRAKKLMSARGPSLPYAYACFHALTGDAAEAFEELERALNRGQDVEAVLADDDWRALRDDPRWDERVVSRAKKWKITSDPPGARIFIDGADTGAVTPARVRGPGPGVHRVRLVLAGHADDEIDIEASDALDMRRALEPLAAITLRDRMKTEGERPPSRDAQEKTRAFIGDLKRARVVVLRHTTYGLGGLRIEVCGDGSARVEKERFHQGDTEHRCLVELDASPVFDALVEAAFTEMVIAPVPGLPDEIYVSLALEAAGGRHELGKFARGPHARFDRLVGVIREQVGARLDEDTRRRLTL